MNANVRINRDIYHFLIINFKPSHNYYENNARIEDFCVTLQAEIINTYINRNGTIRRKIQIVSSTSGIHG